MRKAFRWFQYLMVPLVQDRIGRGPIAYRTRITLHGNGTVTYHTAIPGGIDLVTRQWREGDCNGTMLYETVEVVAPLALRWIICRAVATAQTTLLANLKAAVECSS